MAHPQTDTLSRAGETQKLEPRTMRLLLLLAEDPGAVVSVERMLNEVWQGVVVGSASVYQAISQLRRLLGDTEPVPTYIATVPRKGYRLVASVNRIAAPIATPAAPSAAPQAPAAGTATAAGVDLRSRLLHRPLRTAAICALVAIALIAAVWFTSVRYFSGPALDAQSIVVLPFVDMTAEQHDQFFCDGLTEELSNWLAQIPSLRVVARTSAFLFVGQHDARQIGRALNTTHVLEGSMRRSGDHVRFTVQLIDARSGFHVWSSDYDRQNDDTIKIQEDIARAVAESLQIRLTADTAQKFNERRSSSVQAYNLYLLARHYQAERTRDANLKAIELYEQALAADPKFALAYVGLAYANLNQRYLNARSLAEVAATDEPLLDVAARLDPQLSELYAVRGALREEQRRMDEAQQDLRRAVALNPNDSVAFAELGRLFLDLARPHDAEQSLSRALVLNPLDFVLHARKCVAEQDLALYTEATDECTRARALQGDGNFADAVSSWLELSQGHLLEALEWNSLASKAAPDDIDLYRFRKEILVTLGLPQAARAVWARARSAHISEEDTNLGMASIIYYESGASGLKAHIESARLDSSLHSRALLKDAYFHVLAGDTAPAKQLLARAMSAPDLNLARLSDPWFARWGDSDLLMLAVCEMQTGDRDSALSHLQQLMTLIDHMIGAGEQRFEIYELRAAVLALGGNADGAMQALTKAAAMGWRRSWWAQNEPVFASLQTRSDFRALVAQVDASNRELRARTQLPN